MSGRKEESQLNFSIRPAEIFESLQKRFSENYPTAFKSGESYRIHGHDWKQFLLGEANFSFPLPFLKPIDPKLKALTIDEIPLDLSIVELMPFEFSLYLLRVLNSPKNFGHAFQKHGAEADDSIYRLISYIQKKLVDFYNLNTPALPLHFLEFIDILIQNNIINPDNFLPISKDQDEKSALFQYIYSGLKLGGRIAPVIMEANINPTAPSGYLAKHPAAKFNATGRWEITIPSTSITVDLEAKEYQTVSQMPKPFLIANTFEVLLSRYPDNERYTAATGYLEQLIVQTGSIGLGLMVGTMVGIDISTIKKIITKLLNIKFSQQENAKFHRRNMHLLDEIYQNWLMGMHRNQPLQRRVDKYQELMRHVRLASSTNAFNDYGFINEMLLPDLFGMTNMYFADSPRLGLSTGQSTILGMTAYIGFYDGERSRKLAEEAMNPAQMVTSRAKTAFMRTQIHADFVAAVEKELATPNGNILDLISNLGIVNNQTSLEMSAGAEMTEVTSENHLNKEPIPGESYTLDTLRWMFFYFHFERESEGELIKQVSYRHVGNIMRGSLDYYIQHQNAGSSYYKVNADDVATYMTYELSIAVWQRTYNYLMALAKFERSVESQQLVQVSGEGSRNFTRSTLIASNTQEKTWRSYLSYYRREYLSARFPTMYEEWLKIALEQGYFYDSALGVGILANSSSANAIGVNIYLSEALAAELKDYIDQRIDIAEEPSNRYKYNVNSITETIGRKFQNGNEYLFSNNLIIRELKKLLGSPDIGIELGDRNSEVEFSDDCDFQDEVIVTRPRGSKSRVAYFSEDFANLLIEQLTSKLQRVADLPLYNSQTAYTLRTTLLNNMGLSESNKVIRVFEVAAVAYEAIEFNYDNQIYYAYPNAITHLVKYLMLFFPGKSEAAVDKLLQIFERVMDHDTIIPIEEWPTDNMTEASRAIWITYVEELSS